MTVAHIMRDIRQAPSRWRRTTASVTDRSDCSCVVPSFEYVNRSESDPRTKATSALPSISSMKRLNVESFV